MKPLFLLLTIGFLDTCHDRSTELRNELDKLQKQIADMQAAQIESNATEQPARIYLVRDTDRKEQVVALLRSGRPINNGEFLRVNDDVWEVTAIQLFTDQNKSASDTSKERNWPNHQLRYTELLVKFVGKSKVPPVNLNPD